MALALCACAGADGGGAVGSRREAGLQQLAAAVAKHAQELADA
jgi:hypothetical protein